MTVKSTLWSGGDEGKGTRTIIADLVTDVDPLKSFLGDRLLEITSGLSFDLVSTGGVYSWKRAAGANGISATGTSALAAGTKNIVPGPAITANTRIFATKSGVPAFAIGELYVSARVVGVAGVGNFTVDARLAASGAVVNTDLSSFDWMTIEPAT